MTWQSEWEIKTKMFEYCEGWKALYGEIDPLMRFSLEFILSFIILFIHFIYFADVYRSPSCLLHEKFFRINVLLKVFVHVSKQEMCFIKVMLQYVSQVKGIY